MARWPGGQEARWPGGQPPVQAGLQCGQNNALLLWDDSDIARVNRVVAKVVTPPSSFLLMDRT